MSMQYTFVNNNQSNNSLDILNELKEKKESIELLLKSDCSCIESIHLDVNAQFVLDDINIDLCNRSREEIKDLLYSIKRYFETKLKTINVEIEKAKLKVIEDVG